jgi:hypothetical protein
MGLRYDDTVIQTQRSDNNTYVFPGPGGSFGTTGATPQLVLAARELKRKILHYAVAPKPVRGAGTPFFPGSKAEDLDIKDSMIFEKANPKNQRTVDEIGRAFWNADPAISHPVVGSLAELRSEGKPDPRPRGVMANKKSDPPIQPSLYIQPFKIIEIAITAWQVAIKPTTSRMWLLNHPLMMFL